MDAVRTTLELLGKGCFYINWADDFNKDFEDCKKLADSLKIEFDYTCAQSVLVR